MVKSAKGAAVRQQPIGEQAATKPTTEKSATGQSTGEPTLGEQSAGTPTVVQQDADGSDDSDDGEKADESTDSGVVEVQRGPRRTGRLRRLPHFFVPAAFTMVYDMDADDPAYDDAEDDDELPELDPDMHADPEHRWDISTIFLTIVAVLDLNLMQLDMKNAFLQSKLDRVLYMYQPDYNDRTGRSQRRADWRRLEEEPGRHSALLQGRRQQGGLLGTGLHEEQNRRTPNTLVSVDAYAEFTFDDEEAQECHEEEYWQKVGSLQFAATMTRPDITFACSKLGSGLTVRSDQHWRDVDRCLAYLANMRDSALEFGGGADSLKLVGYVDADEADDKQHRTSTSGYVFVFGGATISWSSQRIKCATLSSTESETPTVLRVDNKSAITVAEGMGLMGNLKHMERRQAWLQHMVKRGKFSQRYIPTAEQQADFLTKALHYPAFNRCSVAIG
ncbi:unnamed protein product [Closterium sp. NIES-53]